MATGDLKLLEWLEGKLKFCHPGPPRGGKPRIPTEGTRQLSLSSTSLYTNRLPWQLKIVVKSLSCGEYHCRQLLGVSALILLAPRPLPNQTAEDYTSTVLNSMIPSTTYHSPSAASGIRSTSSASGIHSTLSVSEFRVPLLVLAPSHMEEAWLPHWNVLRIALNQLAQSSAAVFSHVTFCTLPCNHDNSSQMESELCRELMCLADHTPSQPPLTSVLHKDLAQEGVQEYFVPLVVRDADIRRQNGLPSQPPHQLIALYNTVLSHLADVASMAMLQDLSWPVHEFAPPRFSNPLSPDLFNSEGLPPVLWNQDYYLQENREAMLALRLVGFQMELTPHTSWGEQYELCMKYTEEYVGVIHQLFKNRIKALLHHHARHVTADQSECVFPWDHVILVCADHMLSTAPSNRWVVCYHGNKTDYVIPKSWLRAEAETSLACALMATRGKRGYHRRHKSDPYLPQTSTPLPHTLTPHTLTLTPSHLPIAQLERQLADEKHRSEKFEAELRKWLTTTENVSPSPLTPHTDHAPSKWAGPLEAGFELLKMKIRTSQ